ncbi:cyclin [Ceratobasidium sp. AG-Ba]|nr:cyclin [Ceratobasidium sp. AG-Ba]
MLACHPRPADRDARHHMPSPVPSPRQRRADSLCTVAQNMCNMVCYLWFGRRSSHRTPSPYPESAAQFAPRPEFVAFISDLLATTQVSQSVITLALHYIYTLKQANPSIRGRRGSEYRLAVTALMLANKFLDDNTYTNKTWSDVSRISLSEINQMEKEFLSGLNHNLYVDLATYESWVRMLSGLIDAKEREADAYRRRHQQDIPRLSVPVRQQPSSHRARSSSPTFAFTFTHPVSAPGPVSYPAPPASVSRRDSQPITLPPLDMSPSVLVPHRSSKRSAHDAFSPATASASALPFKRAIPSPDSMSPGSDQGGYLASAYTADHSAGLRSDLKYLPYHTLASSPAYDTRLNGVRKGVLRYHELQSPEHRPQPLPVLPPIRVPQSACTSPREYTYSAYPPPYPVPPPMSSHHLTPPQTSIRTPPSYPAPSPHIVVYTPPRFRDRDTVMEDYDCSPRSERGSEMDYAHHPHPYRHVVYGRSPVCDRVVAPFANAGPPGVRWDHAQAVYQQPTPNWSPIRGRRL